METQLRVIVYGFEFRKDVRRMRAEGSGLRRQHNYVYEDELVFHVFHATSEKQSPVV